MLEDQIAVSLRIAGLKVPQALIYRTSSLSRFDARNLVDLKKLDPRANLNHVLHVWGEVNFKSLS